MQFVSSTRRSLALAFALVALAVQGVEGQTMFRSGQSVQPVYEGYEKNPDGTYTLWFGYFNRNYEEQPHLPVGESNFFSPGPQDRGQPTHFYNRRQQFMFSTVVPADWGDQELVWTIRHDGEDYTAVGRINDGNWMVEEQTWASNRANNFRGRTGVEVTNDPPTVEIVGATRVSAVVGQPVSLTARANDDGEPGPTPQRPRPQAASDAPKPLPIVNFVPIRTGGPVEQGIVDFRTAYATGLAITWLHHRGPGKVTFSPKDQSVELGGTGSTSVIFEEPGTYVIRAAADDSKLIRYADVVVEVRAR